MLLLVIISQYFPLCIDSTLFTYLTNICNWHWPITCQHFQFYMNLILLESITYQIIKRMACKISTKYFKFLFKITKSENTWILWIFVIVKVNEVHCPVTILYFKFSGLDKILENLAGWCIRTTNKEHLCCGNYEDKKIKVPLMK